MTSNAVALLRGMGTRKHAILLVDIRRTTVVIKLRRCWRFAVKKSAVRFSAEHHVASSHRSLIEAGSLQNPRHLLKRMLHLVLDVQTAHAMKRPSAARKCSASCLCRVEVV